MTQNTVELDPIEKYNANKATCSSCEHLGKCAIVQAINRLDDWAIDNPERESGDQTDWTPKQVEALVIQPYVGILLVGLIDAQTHCVESVNVGNGPHDEIAVTLVARSVVGDLAS